MATRAERAAEAMRKHVEMCQERTRTIQNREVARLEDAERARITAAETAEEVAQQRRAAFRVIGAEDNQAEG